MRLADIADRHMAYVPAWAINQGWCYVWAWIVAAHVRTAVLYNDNAYAGHGFPRIGCLYFDSDNPSGSTDITHLTWYFGEDCRVRMAPGDFFHYWNRRGRGGLDNFRAKLRELLAHNRRDKAFCATIQAFNEKHGVTL